MEGYASRRDRHSRDAHAEDLLREVLVAIRRISHAVHRHSCQLERDYGLTGPQLVILEEVSKHGNIAVTELARSVSLSQATVTGVLQRLERQGLVTRGRGLKDRRMTVLSITERGKAFLQEAPPILQENFVREFGDLPFWEQLMILSGLQRIVHLMQTGEEELSLCVRLKDPEAGGNHEKKDD